MNVLSAIKHLVSIDDLTADQVGELFERADEMRKRFSAGNFPPTLQNKIVALLFLEPSTRTSLSFQAATKRLGGEVISSPDTSLSKGESLHDTLRVVSGYADLVVLRQTGESTKELITTKQQAGDIKVPLINAGDGGNEHPTQALIDLYTIQRRVGRLDRLSIGVGFDPQHSRSIRSFCLALSKFGSNNRITVVSPEECAMGGEQRQELLDLGLEISESRDPADLLGCEIVYLNRFQQERLSNSSNLEKYKKVYRLTAHDVESPKSKIRHILDPLPRVGELEDKIDGLKQAAYFEQTDYGVPVRMAVLESLLVGPELVS